MAIKAVVFDFDGVIADSKEVIFKIYSRICRDMGKDFYGNVSDFAKNIDGNYKHFLLKLGITENDFGRFGERYREYFKEYENDVRMFGGMEELLSKLKEMGLKIGISSNTYEFIIEWFMKRFGIEKYIDSIVGGRDINKLKPDPSQILIVMEDLGARPEETAFIGDMEVDILAGKAAKVSKIIAVTYGYHTKERLEKFGPDAIVDHPSEIMNKI